MNELIHFIIIGAMRGCVYSIIALGFVTIYRTTSVLNFAQGELFLLGAYAVYLMVHQAGLPFLIGFPAAFLLLAVMGLLVERLTLRKLVGLPILAVIMMTIGLSIFFKGLMILIWSDNKRAMPDFFGNKGLEILGVSISQQYIWFAAISIFIFILLGLFYNKTRIGLMMTASADDIQLAQSCGISVNRVTSAAWIVGFIITGLGGFLLCSITGLYPGNAELGLRSIAVVLAGGMESIGGAMIMGPVIGILEHVLSGYFDPYVGGGLKENVGFAVLMIFLLFRPQGLFGWKIIERI